MSRPRKQIYTLEMYLKKIKDGDIDNNADVQRRMVWSREQINELIVTVLKDEYIPPIILGEENNSQLHIADGGCRSAALNSFWNGTHTITPAIENSLIPYKKKIRDKNGNISWEDAVFDIKNKSFEKLPEELKKKFNEYQIETVIHENCDRNELSKYIKRYNNHTSMNPDQKAFTYIDRFAGCVREILESDFFLNHSDYSENDKVKGVVERVVVESVMCANHFDSWKKQPKAICKYLNDHATEEEFKKFADNLHRLEKVVTDDIRDIFNKKDSFIFLTLFDRFTGFCVDDRYFADFLRKFQSEYRRHKKNEKGMLFDEIGRELSTKDKMVIEAKLDMLEKLMADYLHIDEARMDSDPEVFIAECLHMDIHKVHEDMELYTESLETLTSHTIRDGSKLLDRENHLSLLAMMAYSYEADIDLDDWLPEYAERNPAYYADQKKNYLHMREDLMNGNAELKFAKTGMTKATNSLVDALPL